MQRSAFHFYFRRQLGLQWRSRRLPVHPVGEAVMLTTGRRPGKIPASLLPRSGRANAAAPAANSFTA
jgi:hypothetical protein